MTLRVYPYIPMAKAMGFTGQLISGRFLGFGVVRLLVFSVTKWDGALVWYRPLTIKLL